MDTKVVLITGATGNLGSRIMAEMLKDNTAMLKLLVYGKSQQEVESEVRDVFAFWECEPSSFERIEVIRGDITQESLGVTEEKYTELANEVTHIIHCAANFKLNLSLEKARESIVHGTKHVAALAKRAKDKKQFKRFNHISTVEVAGTTTGIIKEEFFTPESRAFINTYEQAKAEAEAYLLEQYRTNHFPITVYRPAMLVGDSVTGKILNPQSVYHLMIEMFLTPRYPFVPVSPTFRIDPIPLDIIARAICLMYNDPETLGQVYHLMQKDWFSPSYRCFGAQLWRGWTLDGLLLLWAGYFEGFEIPEGVNDMRSPDLGVLIITHYTRILRYLQPDEVHVMFEGRIVASGGPAGAPPRGARGHRGGGHPG
jgi:long-chain acyl-CoA synthetase